MRSLGGFGIGRERRGTELGDPDVLEPLECAEIDVLYDLMLTRSTMTVLITHWRASRYPDNREYILRNETRARRLLMRMSNMASEEVAPILRRACGQH